MIHQRPTALAKPPPPEPDALLAAVFTSASCGAESTSHAVLAHLDVRPEDRVLEIGFGSGRTLARVAARTHRGRVVGVDPSEWSLRHARLRSRRLEASGRVQLHLGRSSDLSVLPEETFDKAYAVHVVYFWRESQEDLAEIRRVLRPGGTLLLGYRPTPAFDGLPAAGPRAPVEEVESRLRGAGFRGVGTVHEGVGARLRAWTRASR
jgi:SAM-dependent methyltransferase